jgi:hypothetical protein
MPNSSSGTVAVADLRFFLGTGAILLGTGQKVVLGTGRFLFRGQVKKALEFKRKKSVLPSYPIATTFYPDSVDRRQVLINVCSYAPGV